MLNYFKPLKFTDICFDANIWFIFINIPYALEKNVYSAIAQYNVL